MFAFCLQSVEDTKVIPQLMDHILKDDAMGFIQIRVFPLKLWQNTVFELVMFQAVVVDKAAGAEAVE